MHKQLLLLLLPAITQAASRIVGGTRIPITTAPYQLSLRRWGRHLCGAALLSPTIAVSAAHCFSAPGAYSIKAGITNLHEPGTVVHVNLSLVHPKFMKSPADYDLAVLFLASPLPLSDKIKPVALPKEGPEGQVRGGMVGRVSGWGKASASSKNVRSEELRAVDLPVVPQLKCNVTYLGRVTERMFCAGLALGGKDSCTGDSGGPFVVEGVLYGVVSGGRECGRAGYPGIYTNVQVLRGYIRENAGL
ncbi:trypsin-1-like [Zophobas morio]|uniref:trypsin-1-like n=1 Tax=Zophobas morio TaxID=2755281 RepID=UPI003083EC3E